jgi:peptide deformylase
MVSTEVEGFHAGVVQHENDHLDGILYPTRMVDFQKMGFNDEIAREAELKVQTDRIREEWGGLSRS